MFFNKLCAVALFFNVIGNALFAVKELKNDGSVIPDAVFFTVHTENYCVLHQAFDSGSIEYDPLDCTEKSTIKHEKGHVVISYHDGTGNIIACTEVEIGQELLSFNTINRLDPKAKPIVFMVFIIDDLDLGHKDIIFEGYGGEILSAPYTGKADISDPAFKQFEEKLNLTKVKEISVLTIPSGGKDLIIQ